MLTSYILQADPPKWKKEELLGKMAVSATSVLCFSQGKNLQSSSVVHVTFSRVNTLILVKQPTLLTAVPVRIRTNYKLNVGCKM